MPPYLSSRRVLAESLTCCERRKLCSCLQMIRLGLRGGFGSALATSLDLRRAHSPRAAALFAITASTSGSSATPTYTDVSWTNRLVPNESYCPLSHSRQRADRHTRLCVCRLSLVTF